MSDGLYKLIDSKSFFSDDEVQVSLINLKDIKAGLEKSAADDRITNYVQHNLRPNPGKFYLHINAMGAGEYYGSNKNADYFPESQLKQYHRTFEETGYVYRHHINKDPAKSMGRVIFSIYNDRMHRVELVAEVDMELGKDIFEKIQRGEYPQTSMACRTPWDVCSICGNKAHSRAEYCTHILNEPNRLLPDGRKVMALNIGPLRFFDISIVIKPADVTSSVLQKVASAQDTVLSVDAALAEGLSSVSHDLEKEAHTKAANRIKLAAIEKMSDLIKRIEGGEVMDVLPVEDSILDKIEHPDHVTLQILSALPLEESLNALAELGIIPSISFLATLVARRVLGQEIPPSFGDLAEDIVTTIPAHMLPIDAVNMVGPLAEKEANPNLIATLKNVSPWIQKTAFFLPQNQYYDGYIDTSDTYLPRYTDGHDYRGQVHGSQSEMQSLRQAARDNPSMFSMLLKIGTTALISRFIISSMIDSKLEKIRKNGLKSEGVTKLASLFERSVVRSLKKGR